MFWRLLSKISISSLFESIDLYLLYENQGCYVFVVTIFYVMKEKRKNVVKSRLPPVTTKIVALMCIQIYGKHVWCLRNIIYEKVPERNEEYVVFFRLLSTIHNSH